MADTFGPVYEVTHSVDREIVAEFDTWLGQHLEEMLSIQGVSRAGSFTADDHEDGRPRRVSQYFFDSDADLENYIAGPADIMRQSADDLFAGHFDVTRRVLHENEFVDGTLKPADLCLNCGTTLSGQYCGNCGQRARTKLISIWQLLREAFGDLLELDSRLWRTLILLAVRPGKLTRDYLEGQRARFMPPFRTYLVLSIVFFLVAFFDPKEEFGILFDEADVAEEQIGESGAVDEIRENVVRDLAEEGVLTTDQADVESSQDGVANSTSVAVPTTSADDANEEDDVDGLNIRFGDDDETRTDSCDDIDAEDWPPWLEQRLPPERLKVMCERIVADDGKALGSKLLDNIPAALIALLPLMALVLKALYPLSKRYYVEHVLFVVHYHAFFFLILTLQILFSRLISMLGLPEFLSGITNAAVFIYIPIYLAMSMRRVYGQRWLVTIPKYLLLFVAYLIGVTSIVVITAAIAAFSI